MELQLAALSTYATEANGVNMVLTVNRALRESLQLLIPWNQLSEICRNESFYHRARQEVSAQTATGNKTCRRCWASYAQQVKIWSSEYVLPDHVCGRKAYSKPLSPQTSKLIFALLLCLCVMYPLLIYYH